MKADTAVAVQSTSFGIGISSSGRDPKKGQKLEH